MPNVIAISNNRYVVNYNNVSHHPEKYYSILYCILDCVYTMEFIKGIYLKKIILKVMINTRHVEILKIYTV